MWYAHWDGKPSFDDFENPRYGLFGGWTKPFLKQYAENQSYMPAAGGAALNDQGSRQPS